MKHWYVFISCFSIAAGFFCFYLGLKELSGLFMLSAIAYAILRLGEKLTHSLKSSTKQRL